MEQKVFKAIGKRDSYTIIVDDLDEIKNNEESVGRDEVIINMLKVAREYNLKKMPIDLKYVILLRTEILDDLQVKYSNLNKTITSCSV